MKNNANKSYLKKLSIHDEQPQRLGIRGWLRRLFGLRNEADIRGTIEELIEQEETGEIPASKDELVLLRNILNLHGLTVYDIMIPRADIVAVDLGTSLTDLVRIMSEEAHSRIPVYRETLDDIAGMVHIKDLLACWNSESKVILSDIVRSVLFVAPSMPILELLLQMRVSRLHLALVVDEFGGIDGMVTIEDLVEEIVGDIEDEHDAEDQDDLILEKSKNSITVDSSYRIEDLENFFNIKISRNDEDEIFTVGGLVYSKINRIPKSSEIIQADNNLTIKIIKSNNRKIETVEIRKIN